MSRYFLTGTALSLLYAAAAFPQVTFTFTSFDPPGSQETHAYAVNNNGAIVGYYLDSRNAYVGYERSKTGAFSKPIQQGVNLYATGLNDYGVISGYYYPSTGNEVSFTLSKGVYTDFAYDTYVTQVNSINDNGDLAGIYVENATLYPGFLYVAATNTTVSFSVPGAAATFAEGLNQHDVVVGEYTTIPYSTYQSFVRTATGKIDTFSFPGAAQTYGVAINDCDIIAGSFPDSSGLLHGFYGKVNSFTQIDYPEAVQTVVDGINNHGNLVGSYFDTSGFRHGFLAVPATPSCPD